MGVCLTPIDSIRNQDKRGDYERCHQDGGKSGTGCLGDKTNYRPSNGVEDQVFFIEHVTTMSLRTGIYARSSRVNAGRRH